MAISGAPLADPEDAVWLRALDEAAIEAVQIREKTWTDARVRDAARCASGLFGGRVLVNGRVDIALAAGAAGAHLPAAELPIRDLRERFGTSILLGRSTHSLGDVERAALEGADWVTFGPVFATPSKEGFGAPVGLDALRDAVSVGVPVLALGGIDLDALEAVADTGVHGIAAIRLFADSRRLPDVGRRVRASFPPIEAAAEAPV